jgi:hypothetical protein
MNQPKFDLNWSSVVRAKDFYPKKFPSVFCFKYNVGCASDDPVNQPSINQT